MEEKPATNESGGTPSRTQNSPVTSLSENPIDATLQSTETETGKKEIKNGEKEIPVLTFLLTKIREWRSSRPKREPARFTDHLIGWSTFVMTLTTIGIGIIACLQYRELQISGEQTDQLITIQKKIANLQYLAGSPNVHLHHFNLYHTGDNGRIYGYIRVQNDGTRYQAPSLRIAANLGFRPFPPNSKDDYLFGEKDFVEASPSPLHIGEIGSIYKEMNKRIFRGEYSHYKDLKLYAWGKIHYTDIGDGIEERRFCRYFTDFVDTGEDEPTDAPIGKGIRGGYGGAGNDCPEPIK